MMMLSNENSRTVQHFVSLCIGYFWRETLACNQAYCKFGYSFCMVTCVSSSKRSTDTAASKGKVVLSHERKIKYSFHSHWSHDVLAGNWPCLFKDESFVSCQYPHHLFSVRSLCDGKICAVVTDFWIYIYFVFSSFVVKSTLHKNIYCTSSSLLFKSFQL